MGIKQDVLQEICNVAIQQVQELYPNMEMMFIPHHEGAFHEIVETSEHELTKHPAGKIAQTILEKNNNKDLSSFLGMAIDHAVKWFGLASRDSILGLFNVNIDEFGNSKQARRTVYHMIWHALDLVEVRQRPEYAEQVPVRPDDPQTIPDESGET